MQSKPHLGLTRPLILTAALLSASSLAACGTHPSAKINVATEFRKPCVGATTPMRTQADDDAFKMAQERALQECDSKRVGLVNLIDKAQRKPKPWWALHKPDS